MMLSVFYKLINSFRKFRFNKTDELDGLELDYVLISSIYATQQIAYLNSYSTGLSVSHLKLMLEKYWEIVDTETAIIEIENLLNKDVDFKFNIIVDCLQNLDNYPSILNSQLNENELFYYTRILRTTRDFVPVLIENDFIKSEKELINVFEIGWHFGRGAFIARCCFDLGYIDKYELKSILSKFYNMSKFKCVKWNVFFASYLLGRELWGGKNNDGMILMVSDLLHHKMSPLKEKLFI